jgi:hypothetical protein
MTLSQREQALWQFIKDNRLCRFVSNTRYYANGQRLSFLSDIGTRFDLTETLFYTAGNYT